jgi:hypothetical protein
MRLSTGTDLAVDSAVPPTVDEEGLFSTQCCAFGTGLNLLFLTGTSGFGVSSGAKLSGIPAARRGSRSALSMSRPSSLAYPQLCRCGRLDLLFKLALAIIQSIDLNCGRQRPKANPTRLSHGVVKHASQCSHAISSTVRRCAIL